MAAGLTSAIVFDQFCERCDAYINRCDGQEALYSAPWLHSQLGDMESTAQSGCHLCSILVRCIGATYPEESAQISISLFVKGNDTLRIQVGSDPVRHTPLLRLSSLKNGDAELIFGFRDSLSTTDSKSRLHKQILDWMRECQNHHENCYQKAGFRLPTRLLYLSGEYMKLVNAEGVLPPNTDYMTLSHRWPKVPSLKLEKITLTQFQKGIPLLQMPSLFKDVCEISAALGCSYTWIDALCIVQDDDHDWNKESALMVDVYTNSQLNIVAGRSQQGEGLYSTAKSLMLSPVIIKESGLAKTFGADAIFAFGSDETAQIARLPTDHRAWILQECEISPRMVYFGDVETVWECGSKLQCESSQPGGISRVPSDFSNDPRNIRAEMARFRRDHIGLTEARCSSIWTSLVSKYTSLDISFESDRLVAISGLSQYLQQEASDQFGKYYAGLWEVGFEQQLLWRSDYNDSGVTASASYLAPSWSWSSHTSRTFYHATAPGARSILSLIENLTVSIMPKSPTASHGQIKDGHFSCLANICQVYLSYEQIGTQWAWTWSVQHSAYTSRSRIDIDITLDRPNELSATPDGQSLFRDFYLMPLLCHDLSDYGNQYKRRPWCSRLFTEWQCSDGTISPKSLPKGRWNSPRADDEGYSLAALVLFPIVGRKGCYTRAGIAGFSSPDTIVLLQDACRLSCLSPEVYVDNVADRHAYEICVF